MAFSFQLVYVIALVSLSCYAGSLSDLRFLVLARDVFLVLVFRTWLRRVIKTDSARSMPGLGVFERSSSIINVCLCSYF